MVGALLMKAKRFLNRMGFPRNMWFNNDNNPD